MQYKIKLLLILVFIAIFIVGCAQQKGVAEKEINEQHKDIRDVKIIGFETDKETYGSHEDLKAKAEIESPKKTEARAELRGITPYDYPHIDKTKTLNLSKGKNEVIFNVQTPHCTSGCGGVYPGPYDLTIELIAEDKAIANSTTTIELVN